MCGVFGVHGHPEAANITYLGIHALQHRGQESAGIASADGGRIHAEIVAGHVADGFGREAMARLPGRHAIGHVRYSTAGGSDMPNAQPFVVSYSHGAVAVAHNGNLVNADVLRAELEAKGSIFRSTADTEVIVHLMARAQGSTVERLQSALSQVKGAFSLVVLTATELIAVRDPLGFRPLSLGRLKDAFAFASESCAFDLIEGELIRDVEPGEMLVVDDTGLRSLRPFDDAGPTDAHFCVFEHVYFARPDSRVNDRSIYKARKASGRQLAKEHPVEADVVIPVPDSGISAAMGYSEESGLPYELGLIRSHYVGRTFIEPQQSIRDFGVKLKLNAVREVLAGKRVVAIDDSIVRGTTSRKIVKMLRDAGAREVHMRISSPPVTGPCFYGIDTPSKSELIASSYTVEEIARYLTCDSLGYLSPEGLMASVGSPEGTAGWCSACFTGHYPVAVQDAPRARGETGPIVQHMERLEVSR